MSAVEKLFCAAVDAAQGRHPPQSRFGNPCSRMFVSMKFS
jgi:hypothetical protein